MPLDIGNIVRSKSRPELGRLRVASVLEGGKAIPPAVKVAYTDPATGKIVTSSWSQDDLEIVGGLDAEQEDAEKAKKIAAIMGAVVGLLDHYDYIMDHSSSSHDRTTVMVPCSLIEELHAAAKALDMPVTCARHPDRYVFVNDPNARNWLTMKEFSRRKGAFVVIRYCPECAARHARGELV
jgi:hypothetical protein